MLLQTPHFQEETQAAGRRGCGPGLRDTIARVCWSSSQTPRAGSGCPAGDACKRNISHGPSSMPCLCPSISPHFSPADRDGWQPALPGNPIRGEKCGLDVDRLLHTHAQIASRRPLRSLRILLYATFCQEANGCWVLDWEDLDDLLIVWRDYMNLVHHGGFLIRVRREHLVNAVLQFLEHGVGVDGSAPWDACNSDAVSSKEPCN